MCTLFWEVIHVINPHLPIICFLIPLWFQTLPFRKSIHHCWRYLGDQSHYQLHHAFLYLRKKPILQYITNKTKYWHNNIIYYYYLTSFIEKETKRKNWWSDSLWPIYWILHLSAKVNRRIALLNGEHCWQMKPFYLMACLEHAYCCNFWVKSNNNFSSFCSKSRSLCSLDICNKAFLLYFQLEMFQKFCLLRFQFIFILVVIWIPYDGIIL